MAHEIEQFENGSAAFISARTDAWHRLGTVLDDCFDAETALTTAHLGGWNVHRTALMAVVPEGAPDATKHLKPGRSALIHRTADGQLQILGQAVPLNDRYATVRTNPVTAQPEALGVVGGFYRPMQNEELCDLLNLLVDESGAHFETAGSLRQGREVFVTMKMPDSLTIGGIDQIDLCIAALNSHDGTSPSRLLITPTRIVCANTQAAALRNAKATHSIRHTSGATGKIEEVRQALGLTWKYAEEFQAEAEKMIQASLTDGEFLDIVQRELYAAPEDDASKQAHTMHSKLMDTLGALFADADTQAAIRSTRWAGYQAVTEYLDHAMPVRGGDGAQAQVLRAERAITQPYITQLKSRAFTAFAA